METAETYEVMTVEEMKERFPNECILIGDPEDDEYGRTIRGKVLFHGPEKEDMYAKLLELRPKRAASLYTKPLPEFINFNL